MALVWVVGIRAASAAGVLVFVLLVGWMRWPLALLYTAAVMLGLELLAGALGVHLPARQMRLF